MLIGMDRKEVIMKKPAKVHKDSNPGMSTITPASLTLFKKAGDEVAWEIDAVLTTTEFLVVKSSNSTIVPDTSGGGGSSKFGLTPNYPSTPGLFNVSYEISINNGSSNKVASGFLVIDTIGEGEPHPGGGK